MNILNTKLYNLKQIRNKQKSQMKRDDIIYFNEFQRLHDIMYSLRCLTKHRWKHITCICIGCEYLFGLNRGDLKISRIIVY